MQRCDREDDEPERVLNLEYDLVDGAGDPRAETPSAGTANCTLTITRRAVGMGEMAEGPKAPDNHAEENHLVVEC